MYPLFKTFQSFISKCKRSNVIESITRMRIENGTVTFTDLESTVTFRLPDDQIPADGCYELLNGELYLSGPLDNDFPLLPHVEPDAKALLPAGALFCSSRG